MSSDWWDYIGPGHIPMLAAIGEGLVTRDPDGGLFAPYMFDGEPLGTNQVRHLATLGVVEVRLSGPPSITEDGARVLREWDEQEWWRRRRARTTERRARQRRWEPWRPRLQTQVPRASGTAQARPVAPGPRRRPVVFDSDDF